MLPRAVCLVERPAPSVNGGRLPNLSRRLFLPRLGRRLLFVVTTAGASSATAFRFRGGRL